MRYSRTIIPCLLTIFIMAIGTATAQQMPGTKTKQEHVGEKPIPYFEPEEAPTITGSTVEKVVIEPEEPTVEEQPLVLEKMIETVKKNISEENYEEAIAVVDKLIKTFPQAPAGYRLRGDILFEMEEYKVALRSYKRVLNHFKEDPIFNKNLAITYKNLKMIQETINQLVYIKRFQDETVWAHMELGQLYLDLDNPLEAASHLKVASISFEYRFTAEEKVFILSTLALAYVKLGKMEDTRNVLEKFNEQEQSLSPVIRVKGFLSLLEDKKEEALDLMTRVAAYYPDDLDLYLALANQHLERNEPGKAFKYLESSTSEKKTSDETFLTQYARVAEESGNKDKAIWAYRFLYKNKPDNSDIRNSLIEAFERTGQLEEAESIYRDIIISDQDNESAQLSLVRNLRYQGKFDESREILTGLLENKPQDSVLLVEKGLLFFSEGQLRKAITTLEKAHALDSAAQAEEEAAEEEEEEEEEEETVEKTLGASPAARALSLVYLSRGLVFYYWDLPDKALEQMRLALKYDSDTPVLQKFVEELNTLKNAHPKALKLVVENMEKKEISSFAPEDKARLAVFYARLGRDEDARSLLAEALQDMPDLLPVRLNQAYLLKQEGKTSEAETLLDAILNEVPHYLPAHFLLADLYFSRREIHRATAEHALCFAPISNFWKYAGELGITIFKPHFDLSPSQYSVLLISSGHGKVRSNLGDLYQQQDKYREAILQYRFALTVDENDTETAFQLGNAYFKSGDLAKAAETFEDLLTRDPKHVYALTNLGLIRQREGTLEESISYFNKAIEQDDTIASIFNNLGIAYLAAGEPDKAIKALDNAIKINPTYGSALTNLGNAYLAAGDKEQAQKYYLKSTEIDVDNPEAYFNLGNIYLEDEKLNEAIEYFDKAITADDKYGQAYINKGIVLDRQGNTGQALESYKLGTQFSPEDFRAFFNLGNLLGDQDNHAEAVAALEKAVELAPGEINARLNLGVQLMKVKRFREAVVHLLKAVELDPGQAEAHYNLSLIYQEIKWIPRAVESLQKALSLESKLETADNLKTLGMLLLILERKEEARSTLERSLGKKADQPDIKDILDEF